MRCQCGVELARRACPVSPPCLFMEPKTIDEMKKYVIIPLLLLVMLAMHSCRKEIKVCTAKIEEVSDSTSMITMIGDYQISFDISKARFTNGAVMPGDSVRINYIGDLKERKAKALVVYLIPKPGNVVDAVYDPNKELLTKPMDPEDKRRLDEFVEHAGN